jgi:hypothetical protein
MEFNFLHDGNFSPINNTSTTPDGYPEILFSDKMSNTAPLHVHFTIPQASCYLWFCSLNKNWDYLLNVCQSNFSFLHHTDVSLGFDLVTHV